MNSLSINRAWDDTRAFILADKRLIVPVVFAFMILPSVLYRISVPAADDVEAIMSGNGPPAWAGLLGYGIAFLSFIGTFTLILLALGRRESLGQLIALSARRCLTLLLSMFLLGLLLTPIALIAVVPMIMADGATTPAQMSPRTMSAFGLMMILFLLLLFRLFLLFPAVAAEQIGPWQALKRGWALGRGNWLKLVGTFALLFLGSMTVSYVINHVGGTIATVALDGDRGLTVGSVIVGFLAASASAAFQSIQAGMLASLYRQANA